MRIIHLLNWKLNDIEEYLDKIKEAGFDTIQINPMQPFKNTGEFNWWASYQPLDFKIGNEFGNRYDLTHLCEEAKKRNISIVVDIVCNHTANNGGSFYEQITPSIDVAPRLRNNEKFWKNHKKVGEFSTWEDVIGESIGLPGLNLKNKELQKIIFDYLDDLRLCGVKGFRIDAAKHIGLPSDRNDFFERLSEYSKKYNLITYGEFLGEFKEKKDELSKYIMVLTEKNSCIDNNNQKVTYCESHDDFLNDFGTTKDIPPTNIIDEYSKLTEKFDNTLFYVRDNFKPYNPIGRNMNNQNLKRKDYSYINMILNDEEIKKANLKKANPNKIIRFKEKDFHDICMNVHKLTLSDTPVLNTTNINEITEKIVNDYEILNFINKKLGVSKDNNFDEFLMNCIMCEIYNINPILKSMNDKEYRYIYIESLKKLNNILTNIDSNDKEINNILINDKIKKLNNKTSA